MIENLFADTLPITPSDAITPKQLLDAQAIYFNEAMDSKNLNLFASVVPTNHTTRNNIVDIFRYGFNIFSPKLNYNYVVFEIKHNVFLYPIQLTVKNHTHSLQNITELELCIKGIFCSPSFRKVLVNLLSMSK